MDKNFIENLPEAYELLRNNVFALVLVEEKDETIEYYCDVGTGFLVHNKYLITNHHIIEKIFSKGNFYLYLLKWDTEKISYIGEKYKFNKFLKFQLYESFPKIILVDKKHKELELKLVTLSEKDSYDYAIFEFSIPVVTDDYDIKFGDCNECKQGQEVFLWDTL
ncbi:hypothetical protein ACFL0U_01155 [Pseudomonadota bacterium]